MPASRAGTATILAVLLGLSAAASGARFGGVLAQLPPAPHGSAADRSADSTPQALDNAAAPLRRLLLCSSTQCPANAASTCSALGTQQTPLRNTLLDPANSCLAGSFAPLTCCAVLPGPSTSAWQQQWLPCLCALGTLDSVNVFVNGQQVLAACGCPQQGSLPATAQQAAAALPVRGAPPLPSYLGGGLSGAQGAGASPAPSPGPPASPPSGSEALTAQTQAALTELARSGLISGYVSSSSSSSAVTASASSTSDSNASSGDVAGTGQGLALGQGQGQGQGKNGSSG